MSSSSSCCDTIVELCDDCDRGCDPCSSKSCVIPSVSCFTSIITPVSNLIGLSSGCSGSVEFRMRRKNKVVTLQWEPFTGTVAASGISFLTAPQSICNLPCYTLAFSIFIEYKGVGRITHIAIDPFTKNGSIMFYLNTDGTGTGVTIGDAFKIYGSAISWIVD